ncbi:MAG: LexA repressor [Syntrophorhabdus sp. PtaU1.Bin153]|nr:MAG: LexA repressor [Syntrophorhabdus sp. PtaU1.Bin153]
MIDDKLKPKESEALKSIRNYFMHRGKVPSMRELMVSLGYKSPRSATLIIDSLIKKGFLKKRPDGEIQLIRSSENDVNHERTVNIPLVGRVACGLPILAEENIEAMLPVSTKFAHPGSRYFFLRAIGDSMNEAGIDDGDFVVALIDDEATIKEFHRKKSAVILKPRSSDKKHQPIILTSNFEIQGVVVTAISNFE